MRCPFLLCLGQPLPISPKRRRRLFETFLLLLIALLPLSALQAMPQFDSASVLGTLRDSSGASLAKGLQKS